MSPIKKQFCLSLKFFILLSLLVAGTLRAQTIRDAIDDSEYESALSSQGAALMEAGKTVPPATLREQLKRTHYEIRRLPGRAARRLSPMRCYEERRDRTIIIGALYQCGKCDKWHSATSAAFPIAEPDVFVTNYHVFEKTNQVAYVAMTRQKKIQPIVEVLATDKANDIAIIRIPGMNLPPLALRDDAPVGEPVMLISHPEARFFSLTTGVIERYSRHTHGHLTRWRMTVTAAFAKGSSGAPILDDYGNAVGMVSATQAVFHDKEKYQSVQMVFNECVPAAKILELIKRK